VRAVTDTVALTADTVAVDSSRRLSLEDSLGIRISPDALPTIVKATAADSAVLELKANRFYLYGDAKVEYEDIRLGAGKIVYEQSSGVISAQPLTDSTGAAVGKPSFNQGSEKFTYDDLRYNFNTKKAIVRNARTQYGEGYVYSEQIKRSPDQSIFGQHSVYTTCSLDTPHFGIRSRKIKVIPGRIAVAGSSNLEIEGIPTPLFLPFALFPISEQQRSGFRIPSYTLEERRGLGLTNGGYYFYISDKADLLVTANIYSKGSFNLSGISSYSSRYKFNGGVQLSYGYEKTGESFEPGSTIRKSFAVQWQHRTDPKARPGVTFNANVNFQKGNYYQRNSYNPALVLNNQFNSSITFARTWQNKPMGLTAGTTLQQTQNGEHTYNTLTLPSASFYYSQIRPFQRRNAVGAPKWYEKISASYNVDLQNSTTFYDSAFSPAALSLLNFRNGIAQRVSVSAAYTALRFFNVNFNVPYSEYWLTRQDFYRYNAVSERLDTTTKTGFFTARDFNASVNVSTRIYGLKLFRQGRVAGIRHVLTPNIGFTYTPDFAKKPFGYAYLSQIAPGGAINYRSPYVNNAFGPNGPFGNFSSSLNYGLNNNLQVKLRNRSRPGDTAVAPTRNISLIDGLSVGGAYNLAADSFRWSDVSLQFRTNLFDKINISAGAVLDPYGYDYTTGQRRRTTIAERGSGLARMRSANVSLGASFHSKPVGEAKTADGERGEQTERLLRNQTADYVNFNIPWNLNLSYALTLNNVVQSATTTFLNPDQTPMRATRYFDTLYLDQGIVASGDFNLTPRWKVGVTTAYNVTTKQLGFTSLDIYRDLHCFEMRLNTIPFGPLKSYTFTLNVKAAVLQDLRLLRRRDFRDTVY
jgi:hypothetical protein